MSDLVEIDFPPDGSSVAYVVAFVVVFTLVVVPWALLSGLRCVLDLLEVLIVRLPFKVLSWFHEEIRLCGEGY